MILDVLDGLLVCPSSRQREVVQAGDAQHGVVGAVAFETAIAEDLPSLHAGEGVLDAGADLAVGVLCLLPGNGRPTATTSRVSASMTTWWLVEYHVVATHDHHIDPGGHFSQSPDFEDRFPDHCPPAGSRTSTWWASPRTTGCAGRREAGFRARVRLDYSVQSRHGHDSRGGRRLPPGGYRRIPRGIPTA